MADDRLESEPSTSERHRAAGGLVLPSPLAKWSEINTCSGGLHVDIGRAFSQACTYGDPAPATVETLRARARRLLALLEALS